MKYTIQNERDQSISIFLIFFIFSSTILSLKKTNCLKLNHKLSKYNKIDYSNYITPLSIYDINNDIDDTLDKLNDNSFYSNTDSPHKYEYTPIKYTVPNKQTHSSVTISPSTYDQTQSATHNIWKTLISIFQIYLQYFVIISIISFHRSFEEIVEVKTNSAYEKAASFFDLSIPINNQLKGSIHCQDEIDVFASGPTRIIKSANDDMFTLLLPKDYARWDRRVEVFNKEKNVWTLIPFAEYNDDHSSELPNWCSKSFYGKVELSSIRVNTTQLKKWTIKEKVTFKSVTFANEIWWNEFNHDSESTKMTQGKKYAHTVTNEDTIIFTSSSKQLMRVHFEGYPCTELSIVSKVNNNEFRTCYIPADSNEDNLSEHSSNINKSVEMIIDPQVSFNVCNLLFCFCFNGTPLYQARDNINGSNNYSTEYPSWAINWLEEKKWQNLSFLLNGILTVLLRFI